MSTKTEADTLSRASRFKLMELLIVVMIIAIIASIAFPVASKIKEDRPRRMPAC